MLDTIINYLLGIDKITTKVEGNDTTITTIRYFDRKTKKVIKTTQLITRVRKA